MQTLSATDLAIAIADKAGTLAITAEQGRFGQFFAISDDRGLIEVAMSASEADDRLAAIRGRLQ